MSVEAIVSHLEARGFSISPVQRAKLEAGLANKDARIVLRDFLALEDPVGDKALGRVRKITEPFSDLDRAFLDYYLIVWCSQIPPKKEPVDLGNLLEMQQVLDKKIAELCALPPFIQKEIIGCLGDLGAPGLASDMTDCRVHDHIINWFFSRLKDERKHYLEQDPNAIFLIVFLLSSKNPDVAKHVIFILGEISPDCANKLINAYLEFHLNQGPHLSEIDKIQARLQWAKQQVFSDLSKYIFAALVEDLKSFLAQNPKFKFSEKFELDLFVDFSLVVCFVENCSLRQAQDFYDRNANNFLLIYLKSTGQQQEHYLKSGFFPVSYGHAGASWFSQYAFAGIYKKIAALGPAHQPIIDRAFRALCKLDKAYQTPVLWDCLLSFAKAGCRLGPDQNLAHWKGVSCTDPNLAFQIEIRLHEEDQKVSHIANKLLEDNRPYLTQAYACQKAVFEKLVERLRAALEKADENNELILKFRAALSMMGSSSLADFFHERWPRDSWSRYVADKLESVGVFSSRSYPRVELLQGIFSEYSQKSRGLAAHSAAAFGFRAPH